MKFAALLASAFVATAVQASDVTLYYCEQGDCTKATVEANKCTDLENPGYLTSIQNTAECELFRFPGCSGRSKLVPRGAHLLQNELVVSVRCKEPGLPQNHAPAVQGSEVEIDYCTEKGLCSKDFVEPYECNDLVYPGHLSSFQNTADCRLFEYPGCEGRSFAVKRGSHDIKELRGKVVESFECSRPSLPQTLAPAAQDAEVTVNYCLGQNCYYQYAEPRHCTPLTVPGPISSIQNTADCLLFRLPYCEGHGIPVHRGSSTLQHPFVQTIRCSEPGFLRNQRPMRRH
ncbi:hypothetical protein BGZ68_003207 [Mortierella alpina]|nr:hypothetical protein BGZ68_003207 [Mortierella alpina]